MVYIGEIVETTVPSILVDWEHLPPLRVRRYSQSTNTSGTVVSTTAPQTMLYYNTIYSR